MQSVDARRCARIGSTIVRLFAVACFILAISAIAFGQDAPKKKPPKTVGGDDAPAAAAPAGDDNSDPAMPKTKAPPRTGADAADAQMTPPPDELVNAFKQAYKKAGRPKLLFLVGVARNPARDPGQGGIVGGKAQGVGVGDDLSFTDTTGITELLENGIGEILNDDGRLRLIDRSALVEKDRRDAETLAQNDADGAIDAMARKVNADLVLFIKFRPLPAAQRHGNELSFSCISELKDINTAQKMPLTPFNWDGPLNNERARVYSSALARLICERYTKSVKAGGGLRQMSVKIIGMADSKQPTALRRAIRKIDGVDANPELTTETNTEGGTVATYEFEYDGDMADLQDAVIAAARDSGLELQVLDQKRNSVTFRAGEGVAAGPDWWLITDVKDNPVKQRFMAAYKKNPQSVALVINWLVQPNQINWIQQLQQPMIQMQNDARLENKPIGPQSANLEKAESEVARVFQNIGITMIDPGQFGRIAKREGDKAAKIQNDANLGVILQNDDGYDLLCMGATDGAGNLDFKVVNRKNAKWIGGVVWPPSSLLLAQDSATRRKLEHALASPKPFEADSAPTRYIAGNLLLAIEQAIGARVNLAVTIRHCPDQATVQTLADALKNIEEISTDGVRMDNGLGSFNVHYTGAFQDLEERIRRALESKPNVKVIELNPSWMSLDVTAPAK